MNSNEMPPNVEDINNNSMEKEEIKKPKRVEEITEEQRQEEAEKIQDNFRKYAKQKREIIDESFNKEEYERAYAIMTNDVKDRIDEISSFLQEENFAGVRKKTEEAEIEVEKSMGKGKEWLGAGVDFVKTEIIPFLDKIINEETVENIAKTLEKKVMILKRLVNCLENMEGSSQEIVANCKEALNDLKRMKNTTEGEKIYQSGWNIENEKALRKTLEENGGKTEEQEEIDEKRINENLISNTNLND